MIVQDAVWTRRRGLMWCHTRMLVQSMSVITGESRQTTVAGKALYLHSHDHPGSCFPFLEDQLLPRVTIIPRRSSIHSLSSVWVFISADAELDAELGEG